jgi:hypothetical protein
MCVILLFEGGAQIGARQSWGAPMRQAEKIVFHDRAFAIARQPARFGDVCFPLDPVGSVLDCRAGAAR